MNQAQQTSIDKNIFDKHIGFSTNIFDNPEIITPIIEKLGRDFNVIEIELEHDLKNIFNYSSHEQQKLLDKLLKVKAQNHLYFSIHAPYLGKITDIASSDANTRESAVKIMIQSLEITHALGATIFTCHPGYLDKAAEFEAQMMNNLNRSLETLTSHANKLGITISLENTGSHRPKYIVLDYEKHKKLCETHGIGITLDLIHYTSFNPMNDDYFSGLKDLIPFVKNVHFADMKVPHHAHLPLGEGNFDYHNALSFLYQNGYQGNAIIEETGMRFPEEQYLKNAIAYKKQLKDGELKKVV